ncbi:sensor histidine kinase [Streptomyces sp. TS71-3]|uniref:sensor histidine kinase n=1 Tax=Streptomyces sp. TS71-3 TaxID=2733862 RepID=UPI001B11139A|nr:sensor histidine kinase [Streptomyces sp. TS71-3]GHJ34879.1 histidine kinase [Streptomyces sp. TS71-3]
MATGYGEGPGQHGLPGYGGTGAGKPGHRIPAVLRAPLEGRTWREYGYVLLGFPLGMAMFVVTVTAFSCGAGLLITFLGIPVLAGGLAACLGFGATERARARALLDLEVAAPEPVRPRERGLMAWTMALLKSGAAWRAFLYTLVYFPWTVFTFCVWLTFFTCGWTLLAYPLYQWVFPMYGGTGGIQLYGDGTHSVYLDNPFEITVTALVGLVITLATPWLVRVLTGVDRFLVRELLGRSPLASRVVELESDRGAVVDTAAADLRRIERDLHDGAQARLVSLAMELGLAKEKLAEDPDAAARMVDEAHGEVKTALQELRDLARGIHPAVLTDRGLGAALSAVAARCTVPVQVDVDLPARPVPALEGIAYFTVSELLQNVSKHSGAAHALVDAWQVDNRLMLQVTDDGTGGADSTAGSGLRGLAERLGAVDGVLVVDSPPGGPTRVTADLPWRA